MLGNVESGVIVDIAENLSEDRGIAGVVSGAIAALLNLGKIGGRTKEVAKKLGLRVLVSKQTSLCNRRTIIIGSS